MNLWEYVGLALAALLTLGILSYVLFGAHELFRLLVALVVGVMAGYVAATVVRMLVLPRLIQPLLVRHWLVLLPFGLAFLLLFHPTRFSRLAVPVLALLVGVAGATLVGGAILGTLFPQIQATWQDWAGLGGLTPFQAALSWLLVMAVLSAFYYGRTQDWPKLVRYPVRAIQGLGMVVVAITLGALVVRVYQAALLALSERLLFLWQALLALLLRF